MPEIERRKARQEDIRTEEIVLNMGPQHPSTHGVLRVMIRTDGEIILDCNCDGYLVSYLHYGIRELNAQNYGFKL